MATFTVTTANTNVDSLTAKTGGDVYNINGGQLVIDQDSRYGLNQTASTSLGNITISPTLGGEVVIDARSVKIIQYSSGSGNVPAANTAISQGAVTGKLIGVWSAVNVAPTAPGAAMPASGFIKVKQVLGGAFQAGALSGISASSSGASVPGWLEVVGDESATVNVPRLGKFTILGEWYEVGNTSGVANQQFQLPTSGLNVYYPGVWIEKAPGSNDYEFYPNSGNQTSVAPDIRAKVVWINSSGLLRIGHNGTANAGYVPASGLKIRIGNVVCHNCTTANRTANALPNATLANRYDFTTSGGGVIEIDKACISWYLSFVQAFSVNLTNTATNEQISVSEIASPMIWSKCGVGQTAAQSQTALNMSLCFFGGTFTDCHWSRATLASSGFYTVLVTDCSGFTFVNQRTTALSLKGNVSTGNYSCTRSSNLIFTSPKMTNGGFLFSTCSNTLVQSASYADVITGTTNTTSAQNTYLFSYNTKCDSCTVSGLDFFGLTNVQPYNGIFYVSAAGCNNMKCRNIGTITTPLSLGSTNGCAYLFVLSSGAAASNVKIQRCYVSNTRTGIWSADNSSTGVVIENVAGDYSDSPTSPFLNGVIKSAALTHSLTAQTAVYGTHFASMFVSSSEGRIMVLMNESTSQTAQQTSLENGAKFTSSGGLYMPVVGMRATFEMPFFALGHNSFQNQPPVMSGGTLSNYTLEYQTNTGLSWSSWKTLSGANLSAETISSSAGVKLKFRITTSVANTTQITSLYIRTNSSLIDQANQYTLDLVKITLTGLKYNTEVRVFQSGTVTEIPETGNENVTTGSHSFDVSSGQSIDISILSLDYKNTRILNYSTLSDVSIPVSQVIDRQYENF